MANTKSSPSKYDCYAKAEPDEPMFVLLGRDKLAPILVDLWVTLRELEGRREYEQIDEATDCADAMREWRFMLERRKKQEEQK